jgi:hypothetical protein
MTLLTVVPDACYMIERTWSIINWCTYNPNAGCINVPNPNPNPNFATPVQPAWTDLCRLPAHRLRGLRRLLQSLPGQDADELLDVLECKR